MDRYSSRRLGLIVLGGGALIGLVVGLALCVLLSEWIGRQRMIVETDTSALSPSVAPYSGLFQVPAATDATNREPSPELGHPAPLFELPDLEGELVGLSDYQGKVVLINFWATWCTPCLSEMPMFQDRYERYEAQGLVVLAVNGDSPLSDVFEFRDELELNFPILIDAQDEAQNLYRIWSFPTSFVVDREGIIRYVHFGLMWGSELDRYLRGVGIGS